MGCASRWLQPPTPCHLTSLVALSGGRLAPRGTLYAVYEFLERSGVEMLAWDEVTLPAAAPHAPLRRPASDVVQLPSYEYRDLGEWPAVFSNRLHCRRMRLNRCPDNAICGDLDSNSAFCPPPHDWDSFEFADPPGMAHTIYGLLCTNGTHVDPARCPSLRPPRDLVHTHPEWFWPHGDADVYGQVCYHNASLRAFLVSQVKLVLKHQPDVPWLSITQNDNQNDCMDPAELAIVAEEGGTECCHPEGNSCTGTKCCCAKDYCCNDGIPDPQGPTGGGRTGPQMRAVNQVADAVRAEYPNLKIDTFAYEQTAWPPRKTMPASNVIVRVATETANFNSIVNQTADRTADYIRSWANISTQLSIWDYTANYAYNSLIPNPDWFSVIPNRQFEAKEAKVVGYYAEGSTYTSPGRDLSELWIYLNAKMLWNASRSSDELISSFLGKYYSSAAPHVFEYMNAMLAHSRKTGQWCHDIGGCSGQYYSPTAGFLTPSAILSGATAFEKARAAVSTEPKLLTRVDRAKLPFLFVLLLRWEEIKASAGPVGSTTAWPGGLLRQQGGSL